jgi:hypothetical protein
VNYSKTNKHEQAHLHNVSSKETTTYIRNLSMDNREGVLAPAYGWTTEE